VWERDRVVGGQRKNEVPPQPEQGRRREDIKPGKHGERLNGAGADWRPEIILFTGGRKSRTPEKKTERNGKKHP